MECAFKIYIIGFIVCYIIWSCYLIKDSGELREFIILCFLSWMAIVISALLRLKSYMCNKIRYKYKEKYWFCRIDNFNSYVLTKNKRLALVDYLYLKLIRRGTSFYSSRGRKVGERFVRRYL